MAIPTTSKSTPIVSSGDSSATNTTAALTVVTSLFFMWGFITSLNDIIIPHLRGIFDLNYTQSMLVQFVWFLGYFVFALPGGLIVEKVGYKATMVVGLVTMGIGSALFIPASIVLSFPFFLGALIVISAGITVLQVSANAYVSVLGKPETASSRLNLAQAFNSLGTTLAPFFGGILIIGAAVALTPDQHRMLAPAARHAYDLQQASTVKTPYLGIAAAFILLGLLVNLFKLPKISGGGNEKSTGGAKIWRIPHVILGAVAIFVYVGAEVAIGSFLINYFHESNIGGDARLNALGSVFENVGNAVTFGIWHPDVSSSLAAAVLLSLYWAGAMVGRFAGSWILRKANPGVVLGLFAFIAFALVSASMLGQGYLSIWTIILVGLFNSIMFPTIFTLGIAELGPLTGEGSGLLVMAIVGGAIIPVMQGVIADNIGIHHAFILPLICYLYIAFYGFIGSKPKTVTARA